MKNIVIIGSGWASASFLKYLNIDENKYNIIIISPTKKFIYTPLLVNCIFNDINISYDLDFYIFFYILSTYTTRFDGSNNRELKENLKIKYFTRDFTTNLDTDKINHDYKTQMNRGFMNFFVDGEKNNNFEKTPANKKGNVFKEKYVNSEDNIKNQINESKIKTKQYYENNQDARQKLSDGKGKNNQFDVFKTDGTFIKTFTYQFEAREYLQKEHNITSTIKISEVLAGNRKISAGFVFKYK